MKNLTSKTLLIIVLILSFFLFKECSKNEDCNQEYQEPSGLISPEQANILEETYKSNQFAILNEYLNHNGDVAEDNREVWFELNEIKNYIHYVEEKSKNIEGIDDSGTLGLRIYFGAKKMALKRDKRDNIIRSTLFFVPTFREGERAVESNKNITGISPLNMGSSGDPDDIEYDGGN
ncbi:hypothetical protein [Olleya sp. R77988]|uniref:hypothetical protein n=1 Tax=Olleya sp. R77988 TaxID=3093875 RepID=UPI0037CC2049